MRKLSVWMNTRKFKDKRFVGKYERTKKNKRVFTLTYKNGAHIILEIFESFEKAKDAMWKKIQ